MTDRDATTSPPACPRLSASIWQPHLQDSLKKLGRQALAHALHQLLKRLDASALPLDDVPKEGMIRRALDLERLKRLQSTKRRAGSAGWAAMGDGRWQAREHWRGNSILIGYAMPPAASPSAALSLHPARAAKAWQRRHGSAHHWAKRSQDPQAHPQFLDLCRAAAGREKLDAELLP